MTSCARPGCEVKMVLRSGLRFQYQGSSLDMRFDSNQLESMHRLCRFTWVLLQMLVLASLP